MIILLSLDLNDKEPVIARTLERGAATVRVPKHKELKREMDSEAVGKECAARKCIL